MTTLLDSTNKKNLKRLLGKERASMIYSDPVYNIDIDYNGGVGGDKEYGGNVLDTRTFEEYNTFIKDSLNAALLVSKPDTHVFYWCDQIYIGLIQQAYRDLRVSNKRVCLWLKNNHNPVPPVAFNKVYEPCVYGLRGRPFLSGSHLNLNEVMNKELGTGNDLLEQVDAFVDVWTTGYRKKNDRLAKCEVEKDPERAHVVKQIFEKIAHEKWSYRRIESWLKNDLNFKTDRGGYLSAGNLFKILNNTFYYGKFEFPKKSGIWYTGVHEPLITKELFDLARSSVKSQVIKSYGKEFTFTRMIKCGLCGSGITADEKFKNLKDGGVNRYVYYRCCRSKDRGCKNPALNEDDLIKAFQKMTASLELDKVKLTDKLNLEIKRFKKLQAMFLGKENTKKIQAVDLQHYAKFVLKEGSVLEKRSILGCLKNEIVIRKGVLYESS